MSQSLATQAGVDMSVVGLRDEFTGIDAAVWAPLRPLACPVRAIRSFGYSPALRCSVLDGSYELLHTHGLWQYPSLVALRWHRKTSQPHIVSPRGMLDEWALSRSQWKKRLAGTWFENAHLREAACLHALCESEAHAMRAYGLRNPIAVIPNGIDLPEVQSAECGVRSAPWAGVVEPGRKVLLFLSRIHPKKGLANLLRAWAQLQKAESRKEKAADWVLAIAGWEQGGHEAELKQLATELSLSWADLRHQSSIINHQPSVLFLGPQFGEPKAACFSECDAFVLPSFSEGLPIAVLEAWAYSKPVLMTPECNLPEGFAANAAIHIDTGSESIVRGLANLLEFSSTDLDLLGQRGHSLVRSRFAWEKIAREMRAVYEWVLGGTDQPISVRL